MPPLTVTDDNIRIFDTKTANEGDEVRLNIPNNHHVSQLDLVVEGNLVVDGHDATGKQDGILNAAKEIDMDGFGGKSPFSGSAIDFWKMMYTLRGKHPRISVPALTVGTNPFRMQVPISMKVLRTLNPERTLFNPKSSRTLQLRVQTGKGTDIATRGNPADNQPALSSLKLCLVGHESPNLPFNDVREIYQQTVKTFNLAATGTEQKLDLDMNGFHHRFFLRTVDANGVYSNDILGKIRYVTNGNDKARREQTWKDIQDDNYTRYGIHEPETGIPTLFGSALLDLDLRGRFEGQLAKIEAGVTSAQLSVDVLAVGKVIVLQEQIVRPGKV